MAEGIITRHSRSCGTRNGGKCSCNPTFQPRVWSRREKRYVNGPTATVKAEAKAWRVDALAALKKGQLKSATKETLSEVADAFLDGVKSGAGTGRWLSTSRGLSGPTRLPKEARTPETRQRQALGADAERPPRPSGRFALQGQRSVNGPEHDHAATGDPQPRHSSRRSSDQSHDRIAAPNAGGQARPNRNAR